jgi:thiamine-monophosphate kinase
MKLRELGEDALLEQITAGLRRNANVVQGPGDDCAIVRFGGATRSLVLKTDCIVENVHFTSEASAVAVGWKAMARPLSDFAAISAVPEFALVTLIAPAATELRWIAEVYRGIEKAARGFGVVIVGGETSSTVGPVSISVSLTGFVESQRWVSRSGGKPGDELFVTGRLGGSIRAKHLRFTPRIAESRWLTEHFRISAMMDLSDGLGADLPRLARASKVGFELATHDVPRRRGCTVEQAIGDGEDYELLFAISPRRAVNLQRRWLRQFPKLPLTRIGRLINDTSGGSRQLRGYVHFEQR